MMQVQARRMIFAAIFTTSFSLIITQIKLQRFFTFCNTFIFMLFLYLWAIVLVLFVTVFTP